MPVDRGLQSGACSQTKRLTQLLWNGQLPSRAGSIALSFHAAPIHLVELAFELLAFAFGPRGSAVLEVAAGGRVQLLVRRALRLGCARTSPGQVWSRQWPQVPTQHAVATGITVASSPSPAQLQSLNASSCPTWG
jgi:hypothetical protein